MFRGLPAMSDKQTVSVSTDPAFLKELSEYLEVLSNPVRLKILKVIEKEPREISEIASRIDTSYANTKKHIDQLVQIGLVKKEAGFGRETVKGIHPVWKFSLVDGGLETLIRNIGVFSSINIPVGYGDLQARIGPLKEAVLAEAGERVPALHLMDGKAAGKTFLIRKERISIGRVDTDFPAAAKEGDVALPVEYASVTRITKPHAILFRSGAEWYVEDRGSSSGTYINAGRIAPMTRTPVKNGDVIDLAIGESSARFLFVVNE